MLRVALEYCGALVTTAASAEEANRVLATLRPHVLVSDIAMPDDGLARGEAPGPDRAVWNHPAPREPVDVRRVDPTELATIVASLAGRT